jgi:hypothetical protein
VTVWVSRGEDQLPTSELEDPSVSFTFYGLPLRLNIHISSLEPVHGRWQHKRNRMEEWVHRDQLKAGVGSPHRNVPNSLRFLFSNLSQPPVHSASDITIYHTPISAHLYTLLGADLDTALQCPSLSHLDYLLTAHARPGRLVPDYRPVSRMA